ncbi:M23 family metallopeptidase [Thalassovita mediterranea]|jgi:murein DD-endopeptidase MepM/ murein hydrolase activator NlpD|uniref:Putative peptidase n=1 Tax=Thalassovita mediterranea TaxID=340021 RepID=A0A0P1GPX3_9RHOB|nr:M23 family metallopeptidase [Thalassovita mediterranea]CUH84501.1 putative peptidase [Thalassovita mediterranea]SIS34345.1 Peptidase family M23 [Thalassovita mediterranea]
MSIRSRIALSFALLLPTLPAVADPVMVQPIDCTLGMDCYIQYYVDRDSGPAVRDFGCGALSYDGHKGTDFALISLDQMEAGVNVLAAAPGVVRGIRDGMADEYYNAETSTEVQGRECGNGVAIDHGGGWVSQYCHLKQGSIAVIEGQRVGANAVLGQVGLSGKTQFPHLHLSIRHQGQVTDPFQPHSDQCNADAEVNDPLWQDPPAYTPAGIIDLGFAEAVPSYDAVKAGQAHEEVVTTSPALVTWAYAYGSRQGDVMHLRIQGPELGQGNAGPTVVNKRILLQKSQSIFFRAIGRKRPTTGWPAGRYHAAVDLIRDGRVIDTRHSVIELR